MRISTHAPLAGRDSLRWHRFKITINFNPRAPCGARPCHERSRRTNIEFQPTRPLRGATSALPVRTVIDLISTHAPLAGRDTGVSCCRFRRHGFQPTRPLRGATISVDIAGFVSINFNPRAPCGARPFCAPRLLRFSSYFNPRAPCGARLGTTGNPAAEDTEFQPTRPLRGATWITPISSIRMRISTHAPLAGRDHEHPQIPGQRGISTHAPLAGRDDFAVSHALPPKNFNPRAPCGARLAGVRVTSSGGQISTHAPLAGRDLLVLAPGIVILAFQPTRPLRGATGSLSISSPLPIFQPTRPLRGATPRKSFRLAACFHFNPRAPCGARLPAVLCGAAQ